MDRGPLKPLPLGLGEDWGPGKVGGRRSGWSAVGKAGRRSLLMDCVSYSLRAFPRAGLPFIDSGGARPLGSSFPPSVGMREADFQRASLSVLLGRDQPTCPDLAQVPQPGDWCCSPSRWLLGIRPVLPPPPFSPSLRAPLAFPRGPVRTASLRRAPLKARLAGVLSAESQPRLTLGCLSCLGACVLQMALTWAAVPGSDLGTLHCVGDLSGNLLAAGTSCRFISRTRNGAAPRCRLGPAPPFLHGLLLGFGIGETTQNNEPCSRKLYSAQVKQALRSEELKKAAKADRSGPPALVGERPHPLFTRVFFIL